MPAPSSVARRPPITLAQLSSYDDILTDALVDHVSLTGTQPEPSQSMGTGPATGH